MPSNRLREVFHSLRSAALLQESAEQTDGQLLECFVCGNDAVALEALVQRHGGMVWGVCRRLLSNHHDAEDAFQATFLVLVRKAVTIRPREMVGNWLYGVAHQTALKARATAAKRQARERLVAALPEQEARQPDQDLWRELQPVLDQELSRLPAKYRAALVLCDLEGKSRKEAACQLGLPEGTVASRLARARTLLARRLARHGVAVLGGTLAAVLAQNAGAGVPNSVVSSTNKAAMLLAAGQVAAAGMMSANVAALTEGVLKAMILSKLKSTVAVLLVAVVAGVGAGGLLYSSQGAEPETTTDRPKLPAAGFADADKVKSKSEPAPVDPKAPEVPSERTAPAQGQPNSLPPAPEPAKDVSGSKESSRATALTAPPPPVQPVSATEQLRQQYLQLQEELTHYLTPEQVQQRVEALAKEVAAAKEREERKRREKEAQDEVEQIRVKLANTIATYPNTAAAKRAQQALNAMGVPAPTLPTLGSGPQK
jgi:RNA polymerase sigma factor (sigma-70 family)